MTRLLNHLSPLEIEALALAEAYAAGTEAGRIAYTAHALAHYAAKIKQLARSRRGTNSWVDLLKQSSKWTTERDDYLMASLAHLYFIVPPETEEYIREHIDLVPLLVRQYTRIRYVFPRERADLKLVTDPETGDKELVCYVATQKSVDKAMAQLDRYDRAWRDEAVPVMLRFVEEETP